MGRDQQKNPRGPLYLRAYMVLFSVGLAGSMYGMTNMCVVPSLLFRARRSWMAWG